MFGWTLFVYSYFVQVNWSRLKLPQQRVQTEFLVSSGSSSALAIFHLINVPAGTRAYSCWSLNMSLGPPKIWAVFGTTPPTFFLAISSAAASSSTFLTGDQPWSAMFWRRFRAAELLAHMDNPALLNTSVIGSKLSPFRMSCSTARLHRSISPPK